MIEAMSLACPLVLSDTDPVREFADADSATLVPMKDPAAIAGGVLATLGDPEAAEARAKGARAVIDPAYSITRLWPEKAKLFAELARA
jgi:glycosyltransferase involved in cell wall biosynthesis